MTMPSVPAPEGTPYTLDIRLKSDWTYDEDRGLFQGPRGQTLPVPESLGKAAKISHKVPHFLGKPAASLTRAERDLGRYLQVRIAASQDLPALIDQFSKLASVESATMGPRYELPGLASPSQEAGPTPPDRP